MGAEGLTAGLLLTAVHDRDVPVDRQIGEHRQLVGLASQIEGLDLVLAGQHFAAPELRFLQPVPYLASMADLTAPMRVGTGIALLSLLNPIDMAEQMATLDAVTGGRAVFGAGIGYRPEEFAMFGVDRRTRAARFEEALAIMRSLWAGETLPGGFRFFDVEGAALSVTPVQAGGIPIWVAGQVEASVRRAARLGDGWYAPPFPTHGELRSLGDAYRDAQASEGRAGGAIAVRREMFVTGGPEWHQEAYWRGVGERFDVFRRWGESSDLQVDAPRIGTPGWEASRLVVGSADECADALRWLRDEVGATEVVLKVQWPGVPHEVSMDQLERLGSDVLPRLRKD